MPASRYTPQFPFAGFRRYTYAFEANRRTHDANLADAIRSHPALFTDNLEII